MILKNKSKLFLASVLANTVMTFRINISDIFKNGCKELLSIYIFLTTQVTLQ